MYEQVFQFNSRPFTATPYVKHYFAGDAIHKSLGQARLCIDRGAGPAIVVGATGTGKSLLLAMLEEQYKSQFNVVNLGCARLDERRELLQSVLYELQLPFKDLSETELRFSLIDYLKPSENCPNGILLLVDEAHTLSVDLLDEIRLIINFVRDGQPRVRLVMAGSQRLEENLNDSKLESFNQRIAARCFLGNMSRDETASYVIEHIDRAGGSGAQMFPKDSLKTIHEVSDGCPRLINQVCDHALILAATQGQQLVSVECVQEAWSDVQSIPGYAPATSGNATPATMTNDESWTVIEFGQLDDDDDMSEPTSTDEAVGEAEELAHEFTAETTTHDQPMDQEPDDIDAAEENELAESNVDVTEVVAEHHDAETHEDDQQVTEYVEDLASELTTASEEDLNNEELHEAQAELDDHAAREETTTDMEAQLAAVFGDETSDEPVLNAGNSEISDLELEHSQILEQVESEQQRIFGDSSSSVNEGSEALPHVHEESGVESADESMMEHVDELEASSAENDPSDAADEEYVTASIDSGSVEEVYSQEHEDLEAEEAVAQQQEDHPRLRQPVETVDPFDESFAEEENLIDRYAPFVAHQNQSSLSLTSEDLSMLTPVDEMEGYSEETPSDVDGALSNHEDESVAQASLDGLELPVVYEAGEEVEESVQHEAETNSETELDPESVTESNDVEAVDESDSHVGHDNDLATDDVRIQAEEILKRLNESRSVSCETSSESEEASVEDQITVDALCQIDEQNTVDDEIQSSDRIPQVAIVESDYEQQHNALDESQQILNEILEQKNALAQQRESTMTGSGESFSDPQLEQATNGDEEMIIVNRMEQQSESSESPGEPPIPFPKTPVSTGRAERMDYQKLFDQLRDVTSTQQ